MTVEVTENTDPNILRVFIVRHGQTDHNAKKILQGHLDIDINETGEKQARLVAEALAKIPLDDIVSSDLIRCKNTVSHIAKHQKNSKVTYSSNFRERFMGPVEGMYLKDALAKYGEHFRDFGETRPEFKDRVQKEWKQVLLRNENSSNILLCSHGGLITMWSNFLYHEQNYHTKVEPQSLKVPFNTSVTVVDVNKTNVEDSVIQVFGNTDHLGGHFEVKEQLLR